jgi:hypothetical protein
MQIFLIGTQLIAGFMTAYVLSIKGRKTLIQLGSFISFIVLIGLGIAYMPNFYINNGISYYQ